MSWLASLLPSRIRTNAPMKKGVPEGVWTKCEACHAVLFSAEFIRNQSVCSSCDHHHRIRARARILTLLDEFPVPIELAADIEPIDILHFRDSQKYTDRISGAQKGTNEKEALLVFAGCIEGCPATVCAFDFAFMGGSMGAAVGAKFVEAVNHSLAQRIPFICFSASGGARMQEGLVSLMQMAKTSAALAKLADAGLPYISVLTDPTMGGVSASLAMLGDIILAEPNALIGFAGPRVIEQTVRQTLPEGFQRADFLLEKGHIDNICHRHALRPTLARLLRKLTHGQYRV